MEFYDAKLDPALKKIHAQIAREYLTEIGFLKGPLQLYRIIYITKQLFTGLMSPTEWVELVYFLSHSFTQIEFKSALVTHLWNWGDNFLFLPFADETTLGVFTFLYWAAVGEPGRGLK
jgi:hypothetical protein